MKIIAFLTDTMSFQTMLFIGLAVRLLIGMRQFNRRGLGGLQHFNNYFVAIIILSIEWVLKWLALAMMVVGLTGLLS